MLEAVTVVWLKIEGFTRQLGDGGHAGRGGDGGTFQIVTLTQRR